MRSTHSNTHNPVFLLILGMFIVNTFTCTHDKKEGVYEVWDKRTSFPHKKTLIYPEGVVDVMVHRAGEDNYNFLHDAAIVAHKNTLYSAWYNCPSGEMQGTSLIRGRRSRDGGLTWSEVEIIAQDKEQKGVMYVPVTFLSHNGSLYAFISNMEGGPDLVTGCEVFILNEKDNIWNSHGFIGGPFLPNSAPVKMENNNFIMAGRMAEQKGQKPVIPAVAISQGDKLTEKWEIIPLTYNNKLPCEGILDFPETTVIVTKNHIKAFVRNHSECPLLFISDDYGRTWSDPYPHNFPFASSKIYAGRLSTGQNYVLANLVSDGYRDLLALAVSEPGKEQFSKIWKIREDKSAVLQSGPEWSYPCAIEFDSKLYVVYTSEKHHCCLTIIPIESLY